jgi:hypothetical protein
MEKIKDLLTIKCGTIRIARFRELSVFRQLLTDILRTCVYAEHDGGCFYVKGINCG